jgi:hypothetical protein
VPSKGNAGVASSFSGTARRGGIFLALSDDILLGV